MDKPWKVIFAFIGVFIFGSIFGALLALRFEPRPPAKRSATQVQQGPLPGILRHFAERLELTAEQREKIRPLVERAEEDIRRVRQTGLRDTGIILKRLQEDFSGELTPEQRKKLEKMQERQRELLHDEKGERGMLREKLNDKAGKHQGAGKDAPVKEEPAPAKPESAMPGK